MSDLTKTGGEISDPGEENVEHTAPQPRRRAGEKTVVVIGNGMVGLRFCEKLVEFDPSERFRIVTFCEEPRKRTTGSA